MKIRIKKNTYSLFILDEMIGLKICYTPAATFFYYSAVWLYHYFRQLSYCTISFSNFLLLNLESSYFFQSLLLTTLSITWSRKLRLIGMRNDCMIISLFSIASILGMETR